MIKRLLARVLTLCGALLIVVIVVLAGLTQTATGRDLLAATISSLASTPEARIEIADIDGLLSGRLKVGSIVMTANGDTWLAISRTEILWSPLDLLSWRLSVERFSIDNIQLNSLPASGSADTEESAGGGSGGLPLSIDLKELKIANISVGEAVAGTAFDLRASGHAAIDADPMAASIDFRIERNDDVAGSAHAVIDYAPAADRLVLDITAREPSGGAVAALLRLPGTPALDFKLEGKGGFENWSGMLAFDLNGDRILSGDAKLAQKTDGIHAVLDAEGTIGTLVPTAYLPLVTGTSRLTLRGARTRSGAYQIEAADFASDHATVQAAGIADLEGDRIDITAKAQVSDTAGNLAFGSEEAPLNIAAPSLSVGVSGRMSAADWTIETDIESLASSVGAAQNIQLKAGGKAADLKALAIPYTAQLDIENFEPLSPALKRLAEGSLSLNADGRYAEGVAHLDAMTLTTAGLNATASGKVDTQDQTLDAELSLDSVWPVNVSALPRLAEDRIRISANVSRNASGDIQADAVSVRSTALTADLKARLRDDTIDTDVTAKLADLSLFHPQITGAIDLEASATGDLAAPDVEATASGENITLQGQALDKPRLEIEGKASPSAPTGSLLLTGAFSGSPIGASAKVSGSADGAVDIADIKLDLPGIHAFGALSVNPAGMPTGTITLDAPDLGKAGPLLLTELSGSANGKIDLEDRDNSLHVKAGLAVPDLKMADITVQDASLSATIADALKVPIINGSLTTRQVLAGNVKIADIDAKARQTDGNETAFDIRLNAQDAPIELAGRLRPEDDGLTLVLEKALADYKGINTRLKEPATIRQKAGTTHLEGVALAVGSGTVAVTGSAGEALDIQVDLQSLPLTLSEPFSPGLGAQGTLSGNVKASGPSKNPVVDYKIDVKGASVAALRSAGLPALGIGAEGSFKDQIVALAVNVGGVKDLALAAKGTVNVAAGPDLAIGVDGKVPLTLLDGALAAGNRRLTGIASVELKIGGQAAKPQISGVVETRDASFVDGGTSIVIRSIALTARLAPDRVTIERLDGTLATGGTLSAKGTVGIAPGSNFPADLSLKIENGKYADGRTVAAQFSADLAVEGPLTGDALLSGTVTLARVDITIPDKLPRSVSQLAVKHRNAPPAVVRQTKDITPPEPENTSNRSGLRLKVTVTANRGIFVRGRGLDAELGGSLTLTGPVSAPVAIGGFAMKRGRLDILSRRFDFSTGEIGFSGSLEPTLNFSATTDVDSTSITVGVTGRASDPQINLSSSPSLPQEDIMSRLLFGEGLSNLSPLQAAQLASAVATLGGIGGSYSILDRVRDTFGLSDLDVTSDGKGGTKVTVGRQVGDKVYLGVEQGTGSDSSRVKVDIDLTKSIKARGEVGADGRSKAGIFFERKY